MLCEELKLLITTVMGIALLPFYLLDWSREGATMCMITMGLMAALASAAVYVGLMVSKDGAGETPPEADARVPRRTMSPHQPASSTR
jgi:hypothetical protein